MRTAQSVRSAAAGQAIQQQRALQLRAQHTVEPFRGCPPSTASSSTPAGVEYATQSRPIPRQLGQQCAEGSLIGHIASVRRDDDAWRELADLVQRPACQRDRTGAGRDQPASDRQADAGEAAGHQVSAHQGGSRPKPRVARPASSRARITSPLRTASRVSAVPDATTAVSSSIVDIEHCQPQFRVLDGNAVGHAPERRLDRIGRLAGVCCAAASSDQPEARRDWFGNGGCTCVSAASRTATASLPSGAIQTRSAATDRRRASSTNWPDNVSVRASPGWWH